MGKTRYTTFETPEQLEHIRSLVAAGESDRAIADAIGVTPSQLSHWRRVRPKLREALTRIVTIDGKSIDQHDATRARGRRKLDNIAKLQANIDTWLEDCKREDIPPTKSGLCLMLGISKDTLARYLADTGAQSTVYQPDPISGELHPVTAADCLKRALLAVEHALEIRMMTGKSNVAGVIFDLKNNHGYTDKSETTSTQTITKTTDTTDIDTRIKELLERQEQARPFTEHAKHG